MAIERDPKSDLAVWLGEQLREARLAAGIASQEALSRELGYDRTTINKVETGASPASDDLAIRIGKRFPDVAGGHFVDLSDVARRTAARASKHPGWFGKQWGPTEAESTALRWWEPLLIPGRYRLPTIRALCSAPGIQPIPMNVLIGALTTG